MLIYPHLHSATAICAKQEHGWYIWMTYNKQEQEHEQEQEQEQEHEHEQEKKKQEQETSVIQKLWLQN